jgi:hypothetical protein
MAASGNALKKSTSSLPFMLLLSYRFDLTSSRAIMALVMTNLSIIVFLAETGKSFGKWPCQPINSAQDAHRALRNSKIAIQ